MPGAIGLDQGAAAAGIRSLHAATDEFDTVVSRNDADASDTGAAAVLLESVLAAVADTGVRLLFEIDTLADAAQSGVADMAGLEQYATSQIKNLAGGVG